MATLTSRFRALKGSPSGRITRSNNSSPDKLGVEKASLKGFKKKKISPSRNSIRYFFRGMPSTTAIKKGSVKKMAVNKLKRGKSVDSAKSKTFVPVMRKIGRVTRSLSKGSDGRVTPPLPRMLRSHSNPDSQIRQRKKNDPSTETLKGVKRGTLKAGSRRTKRLLEMRERAASVGKSPAEIGVQVKKAAVPSLALGPVIPNPNATQNLDELRKQHNPFSKDELDIVETRKKGGHSRSDSSSSSTSTSALSELRALSEQAPTHPRDKEYIQLFSRQECVDLSGRGLTCGDAPSIARALADVSTVTQVLYLYCNKFDDDAAMVLAEGLKRNRTLSDVYLNANQIGCKGARELASALLTSKNLRHVCLDENRIGDSGALGLADLVKGSRSLRVLDLEKNLITEVGARGLLASLTRSETEDSSTVHSISSQGSASSECSANSQFPSLRELRLCNNNIEGDALIEFAKAVDPSGLGGNKRPRSRSTEYIERRASVNLDVLLFDGNTGYEGAAKKRVERALKRGKKYRKREEERKRYSGQFIGGQEGERFPVDREDFMSQLRSAVQEAKSQGCEDRCVGETQRLALSGSSRRVMGMRSPIRSNTGIPCAVAAASEAASAGESTVPSLRDGAGTPVFPLL